MAGEVEKSLGLHVTCSFVWHQLLSLFREYKLTRALSRSGVNRWKANLKIFPFIIQRSFLCFKLFFPERKKKKRRQKQFSSFEGEEKWVKTWLSSTYFACISNVKMEVSRRRLLQLLLKRTSYSSTISIHPEAADIGCIHANNQNNLR